MPARHTPRYRSTRRGGEDVSFRQALMGGLATDGGLYNPTYVPALAWQEIASALSFGEMAHRSLTTWLQDALDGSTLAALLTEALSFEVPLVPLEAPEWEGVYVLELFHGPTLSFKDFGARTMARLMGHFLGEEDSLTVLVATSGDTGSAVADGFAGQKGIRVVLLYPKGQVSPVQERQLIVARPGVSTLAVDGSFDDCQRLVKGAFRDPALSHLRLTSANSINIGRLLPQMLYYLWAVREGGFEDVVFCVPSGNLGNLTAGVLASLSGLPVRHFIAAHNANDFFPRYLQEEAVAFEASVQTLSNAMDVGAPSNFERLRDLLGDEGLRSRVSGAVVSDEETLESMRRVSEETGYLADPHTAVGLEAARRYRDATRDTTSIVVLSTAHPSKFPETVSRALSRGPEQPERLVALWDLPVRVHPLEASEASFRSYLLREGGG